MARHSPPDTGGPPPKGKPAKPAGKASGAALTSDVGPLPVWGWLVTVVAGVFLYRTVYRPKNSAGPAPAPTVQTPNFGGGVYFVPGSTVNGADPSGATTPNRPPGATLPPHADQAQVDALTTHLAHDYGAGPVGVGYANFGDWANHQDAQTQAFLHTMASDPATRANPAATSTFFAHNSAQKMLGLPYYTGAGLVNPATQAVLN